MFVCIGALAAASALGLLFQKLGFTEANIITIYILSVLIIAVVTTNWIYSLISSLAGVFVFNFLFTEPKYTFLAYDQGYPVTFLVMFAASLITGTLTVKLKSYAREKEEAASLAKNEQLRVNLLRSISHDLRTPLTSISGNASNLLTNGDQFDEETKRQLYLDIYDDSRWLIDLVENLLSITRVGDGHVDLRMSVELMDEVISEAVRHIDRKSAEHEIVIHHAEELLLARIDAGLVMQVFINILNNAVKYTQKGSRIEIFTEKKDGKILVSISDDGPGISEEDKPHIFEMFYSGADHKADSGRSLGLGLALCRAIISAHGGEIQVSDRKPHGTVFTFTLPAEEVDINEANADPGCRG